MSFKMNSLVSESLFSRFRFRNCLYAATYTRAASFSTTVAVANAPTIAEPISKPPRPVPGSAPLKVKHKNSFVRKVTPPPIKSLEECASLYPYYVRRTPSIQLPVYRKWMSGGTRQIIQVKKIDGDKRKFMQDLGQAIGAEKDAIRINPTTLQVEIKGNYFDQTSAWLLEKGF